MRRRLLSLLLPLLLLGACATGPDPMVERLRALSPESRAGFDKYRQFMTELQVSRYLLLPSDEARAQFILDMKVEERLTRYPAHVQAAIWARQVVPGMDPEAIYLSWGRPDERDREVAVKNRGNVDEVWRWDRVSPDGKKGTGTVRVSNGLVVDVIPFEEGRW